MTPVFRWCACYAPVILLERYDITIIVIITIIIITITVIISTGAL